MIDMCFWYGWVGLGFFIFGLILGYLRGKQVESKNTKIEVPKEVKFKLKDGRKVTFKSRR